MGPKDLSINSLFDEPSTNNLPSAGSLDSLRENILDSILAHVNVRGQTCDRAMRELAKFRKQRLGAEREAEERKRMDDERRKRQSDLASSAKRERDAGLDHRPPAVGAHGVAKQDGNPQPASHPNGDSPKEEQGNTVVDLAAKESPVEHQPAPAVVIAQYQSFGDDPTQYKDPTVYGIRDLTPDMTEEEKKEIMSVATYPHDDLADLTPGTAVDHDYSNAKPANQVTFGAFLTYLEPYVRGLTEEDVAFLKERADRSQPFLIPARGTMHYRHVWAKEDGAMVPRDPYNGRLPPNEARGTIEDMNDEASTTEELSSGPLLSRLLATLRHDPSGGQVSGSRDGDGDVQMTNGGEDVDDSTTDTRPSLPSTFFPELGAGKALPNGIVSAAPVHPYANLEQRMLGELRYHGLLTPEQSPEYDGQFDDEVAERLRLLQSELRQVAVENAARKARVLELTEERMAMQEYSTIADDLDNQINAAYTKRNRTLNRPKKGANKARPAQGGSAVASMGIGRNTVSEGVRMLMERRLQWRDQIGPVVDYGRKRIPEESVFDDETMDRLIKVESEIAGGVDDS